jgi:hypothetical protein
MQNPRQSVWSSEYQVTYAKWRRGVLIFYGCVGLVTVAATVAIRFTGIAVQLAGK